jgi:hypothetical protein
LRRRLRYGVNACTAGGALKFQWSPAKLTGLIVQDTPVYFSTFGQVVILVLIQLGGIGIMTLSAALPVLFGHEDISSPAGQSVFKRITLVEQELI